MKNSMVMKIKKKALQWKITNTYKISPLQSLKNPLMSKSVK
jgi:hypothetical protein